jgi:hypothetical protein
VKKDNLKNAGLLELIVEPDKSLEMKIADGAVGEATKLEMHASVARDGYRRPMNICGLERGKV